MVRAQRMLRIRRWILCALALVGATDMGVLLPEAHGSPSSGRVLCEGTELSVALPDGRVLRSQDLAGIVLDLRSGLRLRIDAVEHGKGQEASLWFYTFSVQQTDGTWSNLCLPGPDGRQAALPIPGRLTEEGLMLSDGPDDFQLSCTAGALAKCLRYGYRPWEKSSEDRPMLMLYNACIRMVRADYGGDGQAFTRDGTLIDVYDPWLIQSPDLLEGQDFEAGWSAAGAVCLRHSRINDLVSLEEIERRYPRLRGRTGVVCTEEFARARGAVLFNRSHP